MCDPFAPPLYSPRIMCMCGNIGRYGWTPVIVTERLPHVSFSTSVCRMVQLPYIRSRGVLSQVEWGVKTLLDILFGYKERWFVRRVVRSVDIREFDLIFCSTCMTFPLGAARRLSRRYGVPLVADLRDIIEQYGTTGYMAHRLPRMFGLGEYIAGLYERMADKLLQIRIFLHGIADSFQLCSKYIKFALFFCNIEHSLAVFAVYDFRYHSVSSPLRGFPGSDRCSLQPVLHSYPGPDSF